MAIRGDSGNNLLSGTAEPDDIQGLGGNDTLRGLAGADTLRGGEGRDFLLAAADDLFVDTFLGGTGVDTLRLVGGGIEFNLADVSLGGIEVIDLKGNGNNTVTVSAADITDLFGGVL